MGCIGRKLALRIRIPLRVGNEFLKKLIPEGSNQNQTFSLTSWPY